MPVDAHSRSFSGFDKLLYGGKIHLALRIHHGAVLHGVSGSNVFKVRACHAVHDPFVDESGFIDRHSQLEAGIGRAVYIAFQRPVSVQIVKLVYVFRLFCLERLQFIVRARSESQRNCRNP